MSIDEHMDKEDVVHIHNVILFSHRRNKILPFAKTKVDLKGIMLSEVNQTAKDKYHMLSLLRGI